MVQEKSSAAVAVDSSGSSRYHGSRRVIDDYSPWEDLHMGGKGVLLLIACCMALHLPLHATSLTLSSSGNGAYTLTGSGLNGIQAVDLDVSYDTTDLSAPRFSSAGAVGVTVIGNETGAGRFKVVAMSFTTSPLPSDAPLASITFSRKGEGSGRILSATASGALLNGPLTPISVSIVNPTPSTANIPATLGKSSAGAPMPTTTPAQGNPSTAFTPTNSGSTSPPVAERTSGIGAMALPAGGTHRLPPTASRGVTAPSTPGGKEARSVQSSGSGDAVGGKQGQPLAATRLVPQKSVLERFKEYDGERSMAIFRSFIAASGTVSQEPYPALSDGQGVVRLKIPGDATAPAPAFAVKGARIVGMKRIDRGGWQVELLPNKGVTAASVTILGREALSEYPLVVAPPAVVDLDGSGSVTEDDFALYLRDTAPSAPAPVTLPTTQKVTQTPAAAPKGGAPVAAPAAIPPAVVPSLLHDLNGDGRQDYQDDYIFTVNFLVGQHRQESPPVTSPTNGAPH